MVYRAVLLSVVSAAAVLPCAADACGMATFSRNISMMELIEEVDEEDVEQEDVNEGAEMLLVEAAPEKRSLKARLTETIDADRSARARVLGAQIARLNAAQSSDADGMSERSVADARPRS